MHPFTGLHFLALSLSFLYKVEVLVFSYINFAERQKWFHQYLDTYCIILMTLLIVVKIARKFTLKWCWRIEELVVLSYSLLNNSRG